jgi:DNA-binding NarL/FixJ family response regulator
MITNNLPERNNVLFINSSKTDLLVMEALLNKHFNIINAATAHAALDLLDKINVYIIIYNELTGNNSKERVQILKKIKLNEQYSRIKFFALHQDGENSHDFIKHGFDDAFSKPVLKEEIYAAL